VFHGISTLSPPQAANQCAGSSALDNFDGHGCRWGKPVADHRLIPMIPDPHLLIDRAVT